MSQAISVPSHPDTATVSLCAAPCGRPVRVREIASEPATCLRLREMGFCEDAEVSKVSDGSALICRVCGVRVALSHRLASMIRVEVLPSQP